MSPWQAIAATIPVTLGRDDHLATSDLARSGGPDATLACAECGRAKWMHATRHDTCGQFAWITERSLTTWHVYHLQQIPDLPENIREACARAFGTPLGDRWVREARRSCATAINIAKREIGKAA